jgi:SARP family transcriptional regulator, regulator of embCAB operon
MFQIDVLGPLVIRYRAEVLLLQPMQDIVILALWSAGIAITPDRLAQLIWDHPTSGSVKTTRTHISRARKAVLDAGGATAQFITTTKLGSSRTAYQLASADVDADRYAAQVSAAHHAYRCDQYEQAARQVARAQELWRGQPLSNAVGRPFAMPHITRLEIIRKNAVIIQQKAAISLGQHREASGELYPLVQEWPGEGELWMLLAIALYRSDRLGEACEICRQAIRGLQDLGLDDRSTRPLQELQLAILSGTLARSGPLNLRPTQQQADGRSSRDEQRLIRKDHNASGIYAGVSQD